MAGATPPTPRRGSPRHRCAVSTWRSSCVPCTRPTTRPSPGW